MTRNEATFMTKDLLNQVGLKDWHVRLNNNPDSYYLGLCSYKDKCIILNGHHIDLHGMGNDAELVNTIRHEVAHAIVGSGHEHDEVWASKARELGCDNTLPCSNVGLPSHLIDAIRSGATVEVEFDEQVIRTPKYKVTRLQDRCPECGKVAKEKFSFEGKDNNGDTVKIITLECLHVIKKVIPRGTPFETIVSNHWRDEVKNCQHDWNGGTKCNKCGEFKLYKFQIDGARFIESALAIQRGAGIFDEMGLGKTIQALAYIKFHPEHTPVLYIVKSGLKFQWFKEVIRWLGPEYLAQVIATSKDYVFPNLKSYIVSYDLLRRFPREKIEALGIKLVILDECQQIKNPDSTRTQEVRRILRNPAIKVIPLSGTPWKNRGSEFFPVLNMLDPTKFYSFEGYKRRWVDIYWEGNKQREGGIRHPERFKEFVKDIIIRRERQEVMKELPVVNRTKLNFELEALEKQAYEEGVSDFVKWYNEYIMNGEEIDSMQLIAKMARLRHIVGLAKIPATIEFLEEFIEDTDRKIVIFVHHKDVGHILYDEIHKKFNNDIPVKKLTADLSPEERFNIQEEFNKVPRMILIASTLAAGEGLNLQTGSDCIVHERQWNPQNEEQAEGRFIRIGQTSSTVNATYVEAEGTIDADMDAIIERKRRAFHSVMNKGVMPIWSQNEIASEVASRIADRFNKTQREKKAS